ncbi:MAG TPA: type VII secretion AAA-ATPase EccA, partial [Mycobacterium sp.]|nr:type VII secretion AAA-ATPase EccA [Mycobacterium sp.]
MEHGDTGVLAAQPVNPQVSAKVDGDIVSRFATCCRALGLTVYDRQRPADLAAASLGFAALTRIAHDQCDAWTGLAAAGDISPGVIQAVWRTAATAGVLQRQVDLASGALSFRYDTGLYLKFRATDPDDFQLAYAAALATAGEFAEAHEIVAEVADRRPNSREARWVAMVINYRAERWSDVVKLLTPIV